MSLPLIAIVGAPNVGKSTLFNRLVGRRQAIVTHEAGMTRDRLYGSVDAERPFRIVDTGGMTPRTAAPFAEEIEQQASTAMAEAALILFVVDARAGLTALDRDLAEMLRRADRPTLVVANKVDSERLESAIHEMHDLGLGEPLPVSAEHGSDVKQQQADSFRHSVAGYKRINCDSRPSYEKNYAGDHDFGTLGYWRRFGWVLFNEDNIHL